MSLKKTKNSVTLDMNLLENKIKTRLNVYTINVYNQQQTRDKTSWALFPLYRSVNHNYGRVKGLFFSILVIPIDVISIPVVATHNGMQKLKGMLSSTWYESYVTLTIPQDMISAIENLRPGAPGYLRAKDDFENLAHQM